MTTKIACLASVLLLGTVVADDADKDPKADEKEVNLLVNGSFEEGPDPGLFKWFDKGAKDLKGWTVTRGQLSYVGTYWQHADGQRSLDMHGGPGFGGIQQTFATKKGQKYRVTFLLAGNPQGQVAEKVLGVSAAGKEEKFTFNCKDKTAQDMGWSNQAWDFVATDKETTLEFYTLMTEDGTAGPALDNVAVVVVKE